jgi:hypothetical protein
MEFWQDVLSKDRPILPSLFADAALARLYQNVWPERLIVGTISGGTFLRNVPSPYRVC